MLSQIKSVREERVLDLEKEFAARKRLHEQEVDQLRADIEAANRQKEDVLQDAERQRKADRDMQKRSCGGGRGSLLQYGEASLPLL